MPSGPNVSPHPTGSRVPAATSNPVNHPGHSTGEQLQRPIRRLHRRLTWRRRNRYLYGLSEHHNRWVDVDKDGSYLHIAYQSTDRSLPSTPRRARRLARGSAPQPLQPTSRPALSLPAAPEAVRRADGIPRPTHRRRLTSSDVRRLPRPRPCEDGVAVHSGLALLFRGRAGAGCHLLDRDPGRGPASDTLSPSRQCSPVPASVAGLGRAGEALRRCALGEQHGHPGLAFSYLPGPPVLGGVVPLPDPVHVGKLDDHEP